MLLRDHPLMRYHGLPNWPPTWTLIDRFENKRRQGEIGILKAIELSNVQPGNRFSYASNMRNHHIWGVCCSTIKRSVVTSETFRELL